MFVLLDANRNAERTRTDTDGTDEGTTDKALLAAHLDHALDEIRFLREELVTRNEELRRKDHIIAALTERIPELEAPRESSTEPPERPETASPEMEGVETPLAQEKPVSWWRRLFGP
ncbi:MAG: hypothetical protein LC781_08910 [Actinobacteria bacterium]|nr:hypothetical protein [Actinomycetota bacterium]